ncbi:unnamed protein product [Ranitomeya imitator]|uniref:UBA domain-containing protein n=1 Tax=Ranitomeya imitator TaxID=111125 RepID=A0ABN9M6R2_9NEOB|nr:unnamed protein product [Ranitomeya imitator]
MSDQPPRRILANIRPPILPKPKLSAPKERFLPLPNTDYPSPIIRASTGDVVHRLPSDGKVVAQKGGSTESDLQRRSKECSGGSSSRGEMRVTVFDDRGVPGVIRSLRSFGGDIGQRGAGSEGEWGPVEQLYNVSRHSKEDCRRILEKCQWNLEAASRYVLRRALHPH